MKVLIEQRLKGVTVEVVRVHAHMPEVLQWQRECLVAKLEGAQVQLEDNRLEQELVLLAQRVDVVEELDRLETHVEEIYDILKKREAVGRRLDFMIQEFNREPNTLTSKSINTEVTNSTIELRVLIKQMREQIQNIEQAISKSHQTAKNHKAHEMSGFFVIMSYRNNATKYTVYVYIEVYIMTFMYIALCTPPYSIFRYSQCQNSQICRSAHG